MDHFACLFLLPALVVSDEIPLKSLSICREREVAEELLGIFVVEFDTNKVEAMSIQVTKDS